MARALVLLAPGFEEIEALTVVDILRRCNIDVTMVGLKSDLIKGKHGIIVKVDRIIDNISNYDYDMVVLPGGSPGYDNLRKDDRVVNLVREAYKKNKYVAAICAGPVVLSDAGVLKDKECTIFPGMEDELKKGGGIPKSDLVVVDGNVITSKGPATALLFALKLAEKLSDKNVVQRVSKQTLANLIFK